MNFLGRVLLATFLSGAIALAFAMAIGVPANTEYHSAVQTEIQREINLGRRPTLSDVEAIQKKHAHLADLPFQYSRFASSAFRGTSLITFFVWVLCMAGVRRGWIEVFAVAAVLFSASKLLGVIDVASATLWLAAVLLSPAIPGIGMKRESAA